ncbi:intracellular hyaluronan-binding protein 4-like isoform X2 [Nelusetta ayraudi]|uniref:intracellular hyaluronan-binding protein 4-like isoform X2 n=1 Tax=Nelusetta ayraudi TaxID=303726 RepID=UPI003F70CA04
MLPEAYGCVVANRFVDLDGDVDPFDLMTEIQMAQEKRKKKKEEVDKKSKKKPGQRETQKDRRFPIASAGGDSVPVRKQQEPQEQGRPGPVTEEVQGARKKAVFVERRANQDAILQEFSIPKPPANERPDSRPRGTFKSTGSRGFTRISDNFKSRGKREHDRRSGSHISPEEKREGRGSWNWGRVEEASGDSMEAISDVSVKSEDTQMQEEEEKQNGAQEKDGELEVKIDVEMSLDEWKALQEVSRPRVEFNIRKAEDKIPTKAKVIHQSRQQEKLSGIMECMEDGNFLRKSVNDITSLMDINFGSLGRSSRKGKGSQGGPASCPEKAKPVLEKEDKMVINPNDPDEFPELSTGK